LESLLSNFTREDGGGGGGGGGGDDDESLVDGFLGGEEEEGRLRLVPREEEDAGRLEADVEDFLDCAVFLFFILLYTICCVVTFLVFNLLQMCMYM